MKTLISTCAAFAALAMSVPAFAAPTEPPMVVVPHADLNLAEPAQARIMMTRIRRAAASACASSPFASGTDLGSVERFDDCYRGSVANAVAKLDAPQVTALSGTGVSSRKLARNP